MQKLTEYNCMTQLSWTDHLTQSYGISLLIWDHSVTCHPIQVTATGWYSIYILPRDERLSWPRRLGTYRDGLIVSRQSPIQVVTEPGVDCRAISLIENNTLITKPRRNISQGSVVTHLRCGGQMYLWHPSIHVYLHQETNHIMQARQRSRQKGQWMTLTTALKT